MIDRGFSDAVPVVGVLARGSAMAVKVSQGSSQNKAILISAPR